MSRKRFQNSPVPRGGFFLGQLESGASKCREGSASKEPSGETLVRPDRRRSSQAWFGSDSTTRDSSAARVLPMRASAGHSRRASGCGLLPGPCCNFQTPCPDLLPAREATTNEWGRAPRAAEDCLAPPPWLLSKADSTVGEVPERGLGRSCASTSGSRD